jgi:hypothetical protein
MYDFTNLLDRYPFHWKLDGSQSHDEEEVPLVTSNYSNPGLLTVVGRFAD